MSILWSGLVHKFLMYVGIQNHVFVNWTLQRISRSMIIISSYHWLQNSPFFSPFFALKFNIIFAPYHSQSVCSRWENWTLISKSNFYDDCASLGVERSFLNNTLHSHSNVQDHGLLKVALSICRQAGFRVSMNPMLIVVCSYVYFVPTLFLNCSEWRQADKAALLVAHWWNSVQKIACYSRLWACAFVSCTISMLGKSDYQPVLVPCMALIPRTFR